MKTSSLTPSVADVLKKISDDKTLTIFYRIAVSNGGRYIHFKEMSLTPKQYYSRISGLMSAGLIRRQRGKYVLTFIGKIVYDAHLNIGIALSYYWKLKAIESVEESSPDSGLAREELIQLINALIDNQHIRKSLLYTATKHHRNDITHGGNGI